MRGIALETEMQKTKVQLPSSLRYIAQTRKEKKTKNKINKYNENKYVNYYY